MPKTRKKPIQKTFDMRLLIIGLVVLLIGVFAYIITNAKTGTLNSKAADIRICRTKGLACLAECKKNGNTNECKQACFTAYKQCNKNQGGNQGGNNNQGNNSCGNKCHDDQAACDKDCEECGDVTAGSPQDDWGCQVRTEKACKDACAADKNACTKACK